jgi:hypothetical protein
MLVLKEAPLGVWGVIMLFQLPHVIIDKRAIRYLPQFRPRHTLCPPRSKNCTLRTCAKSAQKFRTN